MTDELDWTVDDVEGCLSYLAQLRESLQRRKAGPGLDEYEGFGRDDEDHNPLTAQLDSLSHTMTPTVHGLLSAFEVGRDPDELNSLISELLDEPTNHPTSPSSCSNQTMSLARDSGGSTARDNRTEKNDDNFNDLISDLLMYRSLSSPPGCTIRSESVLQSSGGPTTQPRRRFGYAAAPISDVTCSLCGKAFDCRSKVGASF